MFYCLSVPKFAVDLQKALLFDIPHQKSRTQMIWKYNGEDCEEIRSNRSKMEAGKYPDTRPVLSQIPLTFLIGWEIQAQISKIIFYNYGDTIAMSTQYCINTSIKRYYNNTNLYDLKTQTLSCY